MFGRKPELKEGVYVFSVKPNGEYKDYIFGIVTGVEGRQVGVNGVIINPVGLKNKVEQGKACLLYTSPSPRDVEESRMPSSA